MLTTTPSPFFFFFFFLAHTHAGKLEDAANKRHGSTSTKSTAAKRQQSSKKPLSKRQREKKEVAESILGNKYVNIDDLYVLKDELGAGAFGVTYLASDKKTGEEVACKIIAKRKIVDEDDKNSLRVEVKIMKHLNGFVNIAGLKGAHEDAKNVYIVMEICTGGELFDRIAERGHYTEKDASDCFRTIMETLAHCHKRGVMHRDLKPENFVLETPAEDAAIKAIDFGLGTFFTKNQRFTEVVGKGGNREKGEGGGAGDGFFNTLKYVHTCARVSLAFATKKKHNMSITMLFLLSVPPAAPPFLQ